MLIMITLCRGGFVKLPIRLIAVSFLERFHVKGLTPHTLCQSVSRLYLSSRERDLSACQQL
jgi:hypothetical protein